MKPNFQKSKLKITPVILMERSLPAYKKGKWPEFWSEMEELRKKDSNKASEFVWDSYPEQVGRPIFMGVDAWERLTVFAKKKGDLKQFFARIARPNDYVSGSEIAFQFQKITNRNQEYSVNTVIKSYYECVLQEMLTFTGNVFIIPATVSTEDEDYWTKVFNTNFKK